MNSDYDIESTEHLLQELKNTLMQPAEHLLLDVSLQ